MSQRKAENQDGHASKKATFSKSGELEDFRSDWPVQPVMLVMTGAGIPRGNLEDIEPLEVLPKVSTKLLSKVDAICNSVMPNVSLVEAFQHLANAFRKGGKTILKACLSRQLPRKLLDLLQNSITETIFDLQFEALNVLCHITCLCSTDQVADLFEKHDFATSLVDLWHDTKNINIQHMLIWIGDNVARDLSTSRDLLVKAGWLNCIQKLLTDVTAPQDYDHLAISLIAHLTSGQVLTDNPDTAIELVPIVLRMLQRPKTRETLSVTTCRVGFAYYALLNITAVQCDSQDQQRVYNAVFNADGLLDTMMKILNGSCEDENSYYVMGALANLCRTWKKDNLQAIGQYPRLMDAIKKSFLMARDVEECAPEFLLANLAGGGPEMLQLIIDARIYFSTFNYYYYVEIDENGNDLDESSTVFEANKLSKVYVSYVNAICSASPGDQMGYLLSNKSKVVEKIFGDCYFKEDMCDEFKERNKLVQNVIEGVIVKTIGNESQRAAVVTLFVDNAEDMMKNVDYCLLQRWISLYKEAGDDGYEKLTLIFFDHIEKLCKDYDLKTGSIPAGDAIIRGDDKGTHLTDSVLSTNVEEAIDAVAASIVEADVTEDATTKI